MAVKKVYGWHFLANDGTTRGGTKPKKGGTEKYDGKLEMCASGFHASRRAIDALGYAQGNIVRRVVLSGDIVEGDDKLVASVRQELWRIDCEDVLWDWARWCALQAQKKSWKDAPAVVKKWLRTGDPKLRDAARDAARAAARDAAWPSASATARDAARAAARAAARDAAWAAASAAQNKKLEAMLNAAHRAKK
jgi:hypothetical protein